MALNKRELQERLNEVLHNYPKIPENKKRDYRWLRSEAEIPDNTEAKALIIKLLEIENKERLNFIKK